MDYEAALRLVNDEIAKEGENYVYQRSFCTNVELGKDGLWVGSCIVGRVFVAAGIPASAIAISGTGSASIFLLATEFNDRISLTEKAYKFLRTIQDSQDARCAWGTARNEAASFVSSMDENIPN